MALIRTTYIKVERIKVECIKVECIRMHYIRIEWIGKDLVDIQQDRVKWMEVLFRSTTECSDHLIGAGQLFIWNASKFHKISNSASF